MINRVHAALSAYVSVLILALASAVVMPAAQITIVEKSRSRAVIGTLGCTVSGATVATPSVLTCAANHNLIDGDQVQITGIVGTTTDNTTAYAKVTGNSATTFGLYSDAALTTGITGTGAYSSGGVVTKAQDVSGVTGDFTLRFRVENMTAGKRALISIQESQDGFVSDIRTLDVFAVAAASSQGGATYEQTRKSRAFGMNRFGLSNTKIRLYIQAIDSSTTLFESLWIEQ